MELSSQLVLAILALIVFGLSIAADEIRVNLSSKKNIRHRLTISVSMFWTTTVVFSRSYRYQWLAVLAAWWHAHNLKNLRPMKVITTITPEFYG